MTDRVLVGKVLSGDKMSSVALIQQYQRLVMHIIGRLIDNNEEREELCQDIFIKVFDKIGTFNFESKLSTWIATISFRHASNHLKKLSRRANVEDIDSIEFKIGVESDSYEKENFSKYIHKLIAQMPEQYSVILTLYHLDGFSYPEIVEITGMPEGTVKNYLFRARKKLKDICEPLIGSEIHLD